MRRASGSPRYRVIGLISAKGRVYVLAEDLGAVPELPEVIPPREHLVRDGISDTGAGVELIDRRGDAVHRHADHGVVLVAIHRVEQLVDRVVQGVSSVSLIKVGEVVTVLLDRSDLGESSLLDQEKQRRRMHRSYVAEVRPEVVRCRVERARIDGLDHKRPTGADLAGAGPTSSTKLWELRCSTTCPRKIPRNDASARGSHSRASPCSTVSPLRRQTASIPSSESTPMAHAGISEELEHLTVRTRCR